MTEPITLSYINENSKGYERAYNLLADAESKEIFRDRVEYALSGDDRYLGELTKRELGRQYFCGDLFPVGKDEVFVDCGAYDGDTLREFLKFTGGKYKEVFCFEPDEKNFGELNAYIEKNRIKGVKTYRMGVFNENRDVAFEGENTVSSKIVGNGNTRIHVAALDSVLDGVKPTFIKMDIEGAEKEALSGASRLIRACKPKLAVCVYHKMDDIFKIPCIINDLVPQYKFYMRHHSECITDTVLYAVL